MNGGASVYSYPFLCFSPLISNNTDSYAIVPAERAWSTSADKKEALTQTAAAALRVESPQQGGEVGASS